MKRTLFLLLLCLLAGSAYTQQPASISGQVMDSTGTHPFDGAVISLLNASDSALVKTTISEANGSFVLEQLQAGTYFLIVTAEAHRNFIHPVITLSEQQALAVPAIKLEAKQAAVLEEVAIVAKIPVVDRKIDRTVVNVDAMISAAGNNVLELLEKSPGVMVDQSNIMLKGKSGVMVYVDDKPTYLSGDALINYLKALPASSVSQVEIITNPPAKYDAAGNIGIINLVTKKSKLKGFNGSFSVSYGQGRYGKNNNSFNFNYRNNKLNVFGTLSGGRSQGFNDLYINRTYHNEDLSVQSHFNQNSMIGYTENYGNARVGMDYYLTEKSTLGVSVNGMLASADIPTRNISNLSDANNVPTATVIADNSRTNDYKNGGVNLNFRHKYDSTGRMLTVDLDYLRYGTISDMGFLNNTYTPDGVLTLTDRLDGHLPATISIYSAKADYTKPLKKDASFSTGVKTSYTYIDNLVDYYTTVNGVQSPDYTKSNHFKYDEMINAAYVNYTKTIKRFSFQAGLRGEGTLSRGNQLGNPVNAPARFKRDYLSIFPTGYLSYNLDSAANHQLNLSYGRRIDRPYYQDLNPFVEPLDKFTFYTGNPLLRPMFTNQYAFTYGYQSYFSATLTYTRTRNEINETIEINDQNLYYSRPGNIGRSESLNLGLNATIPFAKWLNTTIYAETAQLRYKSQLYTQTLNSRGTYVYFYMNNAFKLEKGWSVELSGYYISKLTSAQFTLLPRGQVSLAVQKKILKEKGTVKVSMQDIFWTQTNNGIINNLRLTDADYNSRRDSRVVFLTFSYSFGKPFVSEPKHEGSGAESEQNRVKN